MTSPAPLLFDSYYHIYNRGVNKENLFKEEMNYWYFLKLYTRYIGPIAETYAYCLMKNHFHLLLRILSMEEIILAIGDGSRNEVGANLPDDYPSRCLSNFFNAYSKGMNKQYNRTGSLFQHPFGRVYIKK
jgi:putative transposase